MGRRRSWLRSRAASLVGVVRHRLRRTHDGQQFQVLELQGIQSEEERAVRCLRHEPPDFRVRDRAHPGRLAAAAPRAQITHTPFVAPSLPGKCPEDSILLTSARYTTWPTT